MWTGSQTLSDPLLVESTVKEWITSSITALILFLSYLMHLTYMTQAANHCLNIWTYFTQREIFLCLGHIKQDPHWISGHVKTSKWMIELLIPYSLLSDVPMSSFRRLWLPLCKGWMSFPISTCMWPWFICIDVIIWDDDMRQVLREKGAWWACCKWLELSRRECIERSDPKATSELQRPKDSSGMKPNQVLKTHKAQCCCWYRR